MVAVLEVTAEERPVLMFLLERLIPRLRMGAKEDIETADHLAYILRGLEQAPPGPGEIELVTQDVFALGIHLFSVSVDLEEYWLDLKQIADGREPAEEHSPEVTVPAAKYFPEMVANPKGWSFLGVEGQFTDLGFKLDRLITEESPRARALYNKARNPITAAASVRRRQNAERRLPHSTLASLHPDLVQLPPGPATEEPRSVRPVGTIREPALAAPASLKPISRATYHGAYEWGVETSTYVNADELEPNKPVKVNVGGVEIMLVNVDGKVCAAARTCPHRGWDLSKGTVESGVVTCPLHGAQFDVCSGAVVREPYDPVFNKDHPFLGGLNGTFDPKHTTDPIETYPTRVAEDGEVFVHI